MTDLKNLTTEQLKAEIERREKEEALKRAAELEAAKNRKVTIEITVTRCAQCPFAKNVRDPDPSDSFCSDDEALLCTKMPPLSTSEFPHRVITCGERPYKIKNALIPAWCPFLKEKL